MVLFYSCAPAAYASCLAFVSHSPHREVRYCADPPARNAVTPRSVASRAHARLQPSSSACVACLIGLPPPVLLGPPTPHHTTLATTGRAAPLDPNLCRSICERRRQIWSRKERRGVPLAGSGLGRSAATCGPTRREEGEQERERGGGR